MNHLPRIGTIVHVTAGPYRGAAGKVLEHVPGEIPGSTWAVVDLSHDSTPRTVWTGVTEGTFDPRVLEPYRIDSTNGASVT